MGMNVLVIGPDPKKSHGGMATVIQETLDIGFSDFDLRMLPSYVDGTLTTRLAASINGLIKFQSLKQGADIYHIHMASRGSTWRKRLYVLSLGARADRVVLHVHGGKYDVFWNSCSARQRDAIRRMCSSVGKVVVLSEEWRDFFVSHSICDKGHIAVLHNAVPVPSCNTTDYRRKVILFMGELGERKSPDVLLRAAALLKDAHPDMRVVFAGNGDVERYRRLAADLGVESIAEFRGWVSGQEKERLLSESSIYCLPSRNEGMPMSVLEAMAYGLATVSTGVGGVPQVISDGSNGFLMQVGNHRQLANLLEILLGNEAVRRQIGKAGRATIADSFGIDSYASKLSEIYKEVGR